jgi:hypothetical protein
MANGMANLLDWTRMFWTGERMKRLMTFWLGWLAVSCLAACGDELIGTEISCEWFEGENCWKASLQAALPCTHELEDKGVLSPDGTGCTFLDGSTITFHNPLDLSEMETHLWDFTIETNGTFCMSFSEPSIEKRILVTSLGTYVEQVKELGVQFTCPDGLNYKVVSASMLARCPDYQKILPGLKTAWSDTAIMFSMAGGPDGNFHVFSCEMD